MGKKQDVNTENNAVEGNSADADSKICKNEGKRRQVGDKKRSKNCHVCEVRLLDGTELAIEIEKNANGEVLFSKVVENLDIVDKEYFGLRFTHHAEPTKCWLVHQKPIKRQLKIGELKFQFAVKFYEPEPGKHLDEYTRYLLYLQLREDIVYGRLDCPARSYILLASFTAQVEFGDYDEAEHGQDYLDGYQLGPEEVENDPKFMSKVIELHKEHRGQTPAEAELNFLEVAKQTPRYGVDIHHAKSKKGEAIEVGISFKGVIVYQGGEAVDSFGWKAIDLVAYKRKKFMLKLFRSEKRKNPRFILSRRRDAKNLYKSAIEHHSFFRLTNTAGKKRSGDSLIIGSKFRYSDRTLYQLRSDPSIHEREHTLNFNRAPSKRQRVASRKARVTVKQEKKEVKVQTKSPDVAKTDAEKADVQYEEIEMDQPYDEKFEWTVVEKTLADGSKKSYRRRVINTTSTTVIETTYVIRKGTEEEGHMMEEKPIESPRKDEVDVPRESPDISEKVEQKIDESNGHHQEIVTTTVITKEVITTPEPEEEEAEETEIETQSPMSLAEIKASSKKPSAAVKPLMREDIDNETSSTETTTTTTTTTVKKVLVYDTEKEETIKVVTKEEREAELQEREKQREIEEEQRRQEEIRARNEREAANRRRWKEQEEERKRKEEEERKEKEEEEKSNRQKTLSPELQEISLSTGNEEFDKEFGIKGMDTFLIKTSPMPSSFMKDLEDELNHSIVEEENDEVDVEEEVQEEEEEEERKELNLTVPLTDDSRKAKTLDRKFVRRPPPERSSGYIRRSYGNDLDFDYSPGSRTMPRKTRKYVPLITKEELVRAYSSGGLHDESVIRSKKAPPEEKSKIEYSLKDESGVEQGQQGFVKNLIGRHETIKVKEDEEIEERRRSRVYSSTDDVKVVVPTRSASFANVEKPEMKKTKVPPPVKTKPVVFHADKGGLSPTNVVTRPSSAFELTSIPIMNEAGNQHESDERGTILIPEVTTSTVVFDSNAPVEKMASSGFIDKDCVEPLWGKVVLKQRRSFRESGSFDDVHSNFELMTMKERGLVPLNGPHKGKEIIITNFVQPEVVLDKTWTFGNRHKSKDDDTDSGIEAAANDSEAIVFKPVLLSEIKPEMALKSKLLYCGSHDWDPEDYIDKSFRNFEHVIVEEDECSLDTVCRNVCNEIDFESLEQSNGPHVNKSCDQMECVSRGVNYECVDSDVNTSLYDNYGMETSINDRGNVKSESGTFEESRSDHDEYEYITIEAKKSVNEIMITENVDDQKRDEEETVSNEDEMVAGEEVDGKKSEHNDIAVDNESVKNWIETEGCPVESLIEKVGFLNQIDNSSLKPGDQSEEVGGEEYVESNETMSKWRERARFDSCPNLGMYDVGDDEKFDEVFLRRRYSEKGEIPKERKSKSSLTKLKKQTQRKKAASEGNQLETTRRLSFSTNSKLGRLKQEYDETLATFLERRSKSLDDVLVTTQTMSVSPANEPPPSAVSTNSVTTPPPPDVINHSDSNPAVCRDATDDAFPTPPPDVVTQTMVVSPTGSVTTTTTVTEEVVRLHQNAPEVETHTVIISGDDASKDDLERIISSETVTTSETTISKTVASEVTTLSSTQTIVITGEGEINEELQEALASAAHGEEEYVIK